ncbi:hypothetical protein [Lonepinella sp. BR2474]|uniref:hypothetical protein n=1 Tax=Lonepinella sp. BR2474 TaxID=3434548 RepID=UPI003F6E0F8B
MYFVGWNKGEFESFTVETEEVFIAKNLSAFHRNSPAGSVLLGIFETKQQADDFCNSLKPIRDARAI